MYLKQCALTMAYTYRYKNFMKITILHALNSILPLDKHIHGIAYY